MLCDIIIDLKLETLALGGLCRNKMNTKGVVTLCFIVSDIVVS